MVFSKQRSTTTATTPKTAGWRVDHRDSTTCGGEELLRDESERSAATTAEISDASENSLNTLRMDIMPSLDGYMLWTAVLCDGVKLVQVREDDENDSSSTHHLSEQVTLTAERLLARKPTPTWDSYSHHVGRGVILMGIKFHIYQRIIDDDAKRRRSGGDDDTEEATTSSAAGEKEQQQQQPPDDANDGNLRVWTFACVYNPSYLMKQQVQFYLDKIVIISEMFRNNDESWNWSDFGPILQQRMREVTYVEDTGKLENVVDLERTTRIIRSNHEILYGKDYCAAPAARQHEDPLLGSKEAEPPSQHDLLLGALRAKQEAAAAAAAADDASRQRWGFNLSGMTTPAKLLLAKQQQQQEDESQFAIATTTMPSPLDDEARLLKELNDLNREIVETRYKEKAEAKQKEEELLHDLERINAMSRPIDDLDEKWQTVKRVVTNEEEPSSPVSTDDEGSDEDSFINNNGYSAINNGSLDDGVARQSTPLLAPPQNDANTTPCPQTPTATKHQEKPVEVVELDENELMRKMEEMNREAAAAAGEEKKVEFDEHEVIRKMEEMNREAAAGEEKKVEWDENELIRKMEEMNQEVVAKSSSATKQPPQVTPTRMVERGAAAATRWSTPRAAMQNSSANNRNTSGGSAFLRRLRKDGGGPSTNGRSPATSGSTFIRNLAQRTTATSTTPVKRQQQRSPSPGSSQDSDGPDPCLVGAFSGLERRSMTTAAITTSTAKNNKNPEDDVFHLPGMNILL